MIPPALPSVQPSNPLASTHTTTRETSPACAWGAACASTYATSRHSWHGRQNPAGMTRWAYKTAAIVRDGGGKVEKSTNPARREERPQGGA